MTRLDTVKRKEDNPHFILDDVVRATEGSTTPLQSLAYRIQLRMGFRLGQSIAIVGTYGYLVAYLLVYYGIYKGTGGISPLLGRDQTRKCETTGSFLRLLIAAERR